VFGRRNNAAVVIIKSEANSLNENKIALDKELRFIKTLITDCAGLFVIGCGFRYRVHGARVLGRGKLIPSQEAEIKVKTVNPYLQGFYPSPLRLKPYTFLFSLEPCALSLALVPYALYPLPMRYTFLAFVSCPT
jgi:hypothetical protein